MTARGETATLLQLLRRHYIKPGPMPGGVFVPECGINGGPQTRADALYVGFTSTSGRLLVGHELKVSRADWRRELDKAGKADFWADSCHAWYVVAPSTDVVPVEELPDGWGLMLPNPRTSTRMTVKVKARVHADRTPSWDATRSILARLDTLQTQAEQEFRRKMTEQIRAEQTEYARQRSEAQDREALSPHQRDRLRSLERIEQLLGETVTAGWGDDLSPEQAAAALHLVRAGDACSPGYLRHGLTTMSEANKLLSDGLTAYADALAHLDTVTGGQS